MFKDINHYITHENTKINFEKKWINFKELFDKKNISRKECLLLPLRTVGKALND